MQFLVLGQGRRNMCMCQLVWLMMKKNIVVYRSFAENYDDDYHRPPLQDKGLFKLFRDFIVTFRAWFSVGGWSFPWPFHQSPSPLCLRPPSQGCHSVGLYVYLLSHNLTHLRPLFFFTFYYLFFSLVGRRLSPSVYSQGNVSPLLVSQCYVQFYLSFMCECLEAYYLNFPKIPSYSITMTWMRSICLPLLSLYLLFPSLTFFLSLARSSYFFHSPINGRSLQFTEQTYDHDVDFLYPVCSLEFLLVGGISFIVGLLSGIFMCLVFEIYRMSFITFSFFSEG